MQFNVSQCESLTHMKPNTTKSNQTTLRISNRTAKRLAAVSSSLDVSVGHVIRDCVERGLPRWEKTPLVPVSK